MNENNLCVGRLTEGHSPPQAKNGGSIPAPTLQFGDMKVLCCEPKELKSFVETWHYSKSVHGVKNSFCFGLYYGASPALIGAAIFGGPAMPKQWQKYTDSPEKFLELRRFCCIDDTPKNTESFFISKCLRWLRKNTPTQIVVAYSDLSFGHHGGIYRAANFKQTESVPPVNLVIWNGKKYHYRTSREVRDGKFTRLAEQIQAALTNKTAWYEKTKGKNTYVYKLK